MKKLELEKLAPYLPYDLQLQNRAFPHLLINLVGLNLKQDFLISFHDGAFDNHERIVNYSNEGAIKPVLRPLSDLIDEELWKDLLKIVLDRGVYKSRYADGHNDYEARIIQKPFGKLFKLQNHDEWVVMLSLSEPDRVSNYIYSWLLENHFDVFGLIEQDLAININDIK